MDTLFLYSDDQNGFIPIPPPDNSGSVLPYPVITRGDTPSPLRLS